MEESQEPKSATRCAHKGRRANGSTLKELSNSRQQHHLYNGSFYCQGRHQAAYPALLPLPPLLMPLQQYPAPPPPLLQSYHHPSRMKASYRHNDRASSLWKQNPVNVEALLETHVAVFPAPPKATEEVFPSSVINLPRTNEEDTTSSKTAAADLGSPHSHRPLAAPTSKAVAAAAARPDKGGQNGRAIALLANHFRVEFDASQRIFHYDVDISPRPSKEIARLIKRKLVQDNPAILSESLPVFDGRKNLFSPVEFQNDRLEVYMNLPIPTAKDLLSGGNGNEHIGCQKLKLFRINIRLVSKLCGQNLNKYLLTNKVRNKDDGDGDDGEGEGDGIPLPQDYLHALDLVLRESPTESCIAMGRSLYSSSMGGGKDIGGGAIGLRGFFQSLRPTQQGLALNVDFSVTAFHESVGVIPYLQKRCDFLRDLSQRKNRVLTGEERKEVEKALKNIRVFVCHRDTDQRYRVYSLTEETTEDLRFRDRDGKELRVVEYYKEHYNHDIQFRSLPCLQISRSKPCYLPMELCVVCEGQKFLGKLSDDQAAKILKMGCQRPRERKEIIGAVMAGATGPTCDRYASGFNLRVSKEMTQLRGRVLQPPKLKFGDGGIVRDITPTRQDRQWNLQDSHVSEGTQIKRWALVSFGGTSEQHFCVPKFIAQLSHRCEKLGIYLNRTTVISPLFEKIQVLNNVSILEAKLRRIQEAASGNLQLLICVMEKKHRGYADLKRIAETSIGVVSQCCLYSNLGKLSSQFLVNLALKINAKAGGCNVALYNNLPFHIPRVFTEEDPVIFMGADVTHPHPLDDSSPSVAAVVGSMNWPAANKYTSRMRSQTHRREIIEELEQMVGELLDDFHQGVGKLPGRILFFRDGVSETQFYKVLQEELQAIKRACSRFPSYEPTVTFAVVQKRHHTRLFPDEKDHPPSASRFSSGDENIPPGTVVDTVITHPREFDFYLCSHWGMKGTSRPTHYHILWDENRFKSDELQMLIHNLCYTFARCTKPVSLVPPAYYAHLAAYRGRLYLERADTLAPSRNNTLSRSGPPAHTAPLPKLRDNLKKLMFYC